MRVTSKFWVSAYLRRAQAGGAFATVLHKGEESAGTIYIIVSDMQGRASILGPAPQLFYAANSPDHRQFEWVLQGAEESEIRLRIEKERSFDPDAWVIEVEDRDLNPFVDDIVREPSD